MYVEIRYGPGIGKFESIVEELEEAPYVYVNKFLLYNKQKSMVIKDLNTRSLYDYKDYNDPVKAICNIIKKAERRGIESIYITTSQTPMSLFNQTNFKKTIEFVETIDKILIFTYKTIDVAPTRDNVKVEDISTTYKNSMRCIYNPAGLSSPKIAKKFKVSVI